MSEHAVSLAAEQQAGDTATPVRRHDDEVASAGPRHIDDRLEDIVAALAQRLTGNAALGGRLGDEGQIKVGMYRLSLSYSARECSSMSVR